MYECCSNLEIRSSTVQEFQTFQQWPMILPHDVRSQSTSRSALSSYRVNEHTLCCFYSFFNEIENSIACFIFAIQYYLVILIKPEKRQISDSNRLPMIWNLLSGTVYNVRNLIRNHKLYILWCQFVSYEEPVFDLDSSYHIRVKLHTCCLLHLLLKPCSGLLLLLLCVLRCCSFLLHKRDLLSCLGILGRH